VVNASRLEILNGGFPPRRCGAPRKRGSKRSAAPPCASPHGRHRGRVQMVSLNLRGRSGEKIKDGRHVGLDFYDLLIEAV
jgi:hypothetical protein